MNGRQAVKFNPTINSSNTRIFLLLAIVFLFLGLITTRLFILQVANHEYYDRLATNQHEYEKTLIPKRGEIFLTSAANGQNLLVATNISKDLVYAVPKEINKNDHASVARKLAPLLGMTEKEIREKLANSSPNYAVLKKQLSIETSEAIKQLKLGGIYLEPETIRFYPENNLASQVIGFLGYKGTNRVGQYGIEGRFDSKLGGAPGVLGLEKDVAGRWITLAARNLSPAQDGDNIYLTIDPAIQYKAQEVLKSSVERHGAQGGSVLVLAPKTGAILALANFPDFDPNIYNKVPDASYYSNRTISADYEPGSIFKPIAMSAALNENKVTPDTTYEDLGEVQLDDFKIKNSDGLAHGIQTMTEVLEKSLNTGMVFVEKQLGHDLFRKYVKIFGFGKLVDPGLPGEVIGNFDNLNKKGDVFFGTASYGQGISTTMMQMAQSYTALANGGRMMHPYIVAKIVHPDGREEASETRMVEKVLEPKTASVISAMLVNVVEKGHGKRAGVSGYYIAGKTGTAQVAYTDRVGYDPNKSIGSFIGYGPVDNPAFLMIVRIDNPQGVKFAESTAAPAFGEIAAFILNYLQIPPTR
jgi:cell division protein FtsI/penicillin-binding protein 2